MAAGSWRREVISSPHPLPLSQWERGDVSPHLRPFCQGGALREDRPGDVAVVLKPLQVFSPAPWDPHGRSGDFRAARPSPACWPRSHARVRSISFGST